MLVFDGYSVTYSAASVILFVKKMIFQCFRYLFRKTLGLAHTQTHAREAVVGIVTKCCHESDDGLIENSIDHRSA